MSLDYTDIDSKYRPKLKVLFTRRLKDKDQVEDLVQDTLIKVYKHLDSFNHKNSVSTWIYTIAFNTLKNHFRDKKDWLLYRPEIQDNDLTETRDDPESILIAQEVEDKYRRSCSQLNPLYMDVYVARDIEGLSIKETAKLFNITEGCVKTRFKRAKDFISSQLK